MSLLMDALKRAERAREAKEGPGAPGDDDAQSAIPELRLDPLEPGQAQQIDNSLTNAGFSLEPIGDAGGDDTGPQPLGAPGVSETGIDLFKLDDDPPTSSGAPSSSDPALELQLQPAAAGTRTEDSGASLLPPLTLRDGARVEDTSATLPSLKAVQASVDSYFDGTDSLSISMDAPGPRDPGDTGASTRRGARSADSGAFGAVRDESTTVTGKRLGEEVNAQRAAQNIFEAKQAHSAGRFGRIIVFLVLPLMLAAAAIFGGWYWVEMVSSPSVIARAGPAGGLLPRSAPVPVARPDPTAAPPVLQLAPAQSTPAQSSSAQASSAQASSAPADGIAEPTHAELVKRAARATLAAGAQANAQATTPETASTVAASAGAVTGAAVSDDLSVKPPEPKIVEAPRPVTPKPEPEPVEPQLSDAQFQAALRKAEARLPQAPPEAGAIRIARNKPVQRTSPQLQQAYDAYQRGDIAAARRAYQRVLRAQPNSRDGLLGMAAVASISGDVAGAAGLYQRLLELNPQDSVARAGLYNLGVEHDAGRGIAALKNMLAVEPEAAHLHFSLGNALAEQGRWAEAQEAYFSAVRYDDDNADYAFNLAVALDHLRQQQAATRYYRLALELAQGRDVGFTTSAVRARLTAMSAAGQQP